MANAEGIYRTVDSLKNFLIRVQLRKVTGVDISVHDPLQPQQESEELGAATRPDEEEWVFRWQQKAFSEHEEEIFADQFNCVTALHERYHEDVVKLRSQGGRPNKRLFSYIHHDRYSETTELVGQLSTVLSEPTTYVTRNIHNVRQRRQRKPLNSQEPSQVLVDKPSEQVRLHNRIITPQSESMYLMADLRHMDGNDPEDAHVLCHIMVDCHGVVTLQPDLTWDKPCYRVENRHREIFEYSLEHVSADMSREQKTKEELLIQELCTRRVEKLQSQVGMLFDELPMGVLHIDVLGQIVSAKGFDGNNIYVTATLQLPDFWELRDSTQVLSQISQLCSPYSTHKGSVAHIGLPLEWQLAYIKPIIEGNAVEELPKWPQLYLEIGSFDFWGQHRVEGYCCLSLPTRPGKHHIDIPGWRNKESSVIDQMRRYFIGDDPLIKDITYLSCPQNLDGDRLSRFGFQTVSSGSVCVELNIIHRSKEAERKYAEKYLQRKLETDQFQSTIAALLYSHRRAKRRAQDISKSLTTAESSC
ncbi:tectonic-like complex member MKS1 isoform X2 [Dysidea avara]|uniref:tectonic-like complex member MKS1 isoform X2 n=1 Tax=Dysidea avara TaxID=196820 RepID=UPI00332D49EC